MKDIRIRVVSSFLILVLLLTVFSFSNFLGKMFGNNSQASILAPFDDVPSDYQYVDSINFLKQEGVVNGYGDGNFGPNNSLTRAEFTKIIVLGTSQPLTSTAMPPFPDVPLGEWFTDYVAYCAYWGYVEGYPDGTFKPNQSINKVEALKILGELVAWDLDSIDVSAVQNPYSDVDLNEWYGKYLAYAIDKNLLDDATQYFAPGEAISRGQMTEYIYRDYVVRELGVDRYDSIYDVEILGYVPEDVQNAQNNQNVSVSLCGDKERALEEILIQVVDNQPDKDYLQVFRKDEMLHEGDSFVYFNSENGSEVFLTSGDEKWFFWIDLDPYAAFTHATKIALVDSETCLIDQYDSILWPVVNDEQIWQNDVERDSTDDLVYFGAGAEPTGISDLPEPEFGDCSGPFDGRKRAVVAFLGDMRSMKVSAVNMYKLLCASGYITTHLESNDGLTFFETLQAELEAAALATHEPDSSLNNFFLYVVSHGFEDTGDLVIEANGQVVERIYLDDFTTMVADSIFDGDMWSDSFTVTHDTCYSANAIPAYQTLANDKVGWLAASAGVHEKGYAAKLTGSFFVNALERCKNSIDPYNTFQECVDGEAKNGLATMNSDLVQNASFEKLSPSTPSDVPFIH